jgi:hypothetical protein
MARSNSVGTRRRGLARRRTSLPLLAVQLDARRAAIGTDLASVAHLRLSPQMSGAPISLLRTETAVKSQTLAMQRAWFHRQPESAQDKYVSDGTLIEFHGLRALFR